MERNTSSERMCGASKPSFVNMIFCLYFFAKSELHILFGPLDMEKKRKKKKTMTAELVDEAHVEFTPNRSLMRLIRMPNLNLIKQV